MRICTLFILLTFLAVATVTAQTTYLQLGTEDYQLLDRLETKSGVLTDRFFISIKPVARKGAVEFLEEVQSDSLKSAIGLSSIDRYNIEHMISVSGEWAEGEDGAIDSRRPWFGKIYRKQPDFIHAKTDNFFLVANPVISAQFLYDRNPNQTGNRFMSSRGLELRGWIAKKIGFYTYVADNQEQMPDFVNQWTVKHGAVPGADFYKFVGRSYDYMQARGYIDVAAIRNHINLTFGYDKHFVGDGMRSLFLSDFSAGAPFLRINTRIWKINYQNLYLELSPTHSRITGNSRLPHKYATMHTLTMNVTKWLQLGIFESVVFNRPDRYEFRYMIPIIFYRAMERGLGSPDNVNLGFSFKAIAAKSLQFYGQFMLDEFTAKELFGGRGYWANKFGLQLGAKYFDVARIRNLDVQAELNLVRPYSYSHYDSIANYSHYNQPLAHPLGAGFMEMIGVARYQPVKDLYLTLRGTYYRQGTDTGSTNFGSNIFKDYKTRSMDFGVGLINGVEATCIMFDLNASYELRENLFIDLGATRRQYRYEGKVFPNHTTTNVYAGFRLNIARRDYNFY